MADPARWVPVASCAHLSDAEAKAAMLEAEGIETRIEDSERVSDSRAPSWMAAYPQLVLVHAEDEARAREALEAVSATPDAELEAEALAAKPEPEPVEAGPRSGAPRLLLIGLAALLVIWFAYRALAPRILEL